MDTAADDKKVQQIVRWLGTGSINIFGWPFSGKDTQGRKLSELLNAPLIGGGEILRSRKDTPEHVRKIVDKGQLAPTSEYLEIVTPYLSKLEYAESPLILSSVGRWYGEEETILKAAAAANHPIKAVIYLALDQTTANKRAQNSKIADDRGVRADDATVYLQTRFEEFKNKTLPVIQFYRKKNLLIDINGDQSANEVTKEIINKLHSKV